MGLAWTADGEFLVLILVEETHLVGGAAPNHNIHLSWFFKIICTNCAELQKDLEARVAAAKHIQ